MSSEAGAFSIAGTFLIAHLQRELPLNATIFSDTHALDIAEVHWLAVTAARWRRNPVGKLARLCDRLHEALNIVFIGLSGELSILLGLPLSFALGGSHQLNLSPA